VLEPATGEAWEGQTMVGCAGEVRRRGNRSKVWSPAHAPCAALLRARW
jgi:hypothetical protein